MQLPIKVLIKNTFEWLVQKIKKKLIVIRHTTFFPRQHEHLCSSQNIYVD